jgi:hypothetical protein
MVKPNEKSILAIANRVNDPNDPAHAIPDEIKQQLVDSAQWQMQHDATIYRGALFALGIIAVATLLGAIALAWYSKAIPESVIALGSASVGAIAGLMTPTSAASA